MRELKQEIESIEFAVEGRNVSKANYGVMKIVAIYDDDGNGPIWFDVYGTLNRVERRINAAHVAAINYRYAS